ncbi:uncharacterized protein LOC115967117 [Quercus lobata]|uniref:uncharacterized protein LOC115967117 n=1 Tax=Quercus lobata TaxID=97700 RepID=UPI001245D01D|nr:uncharacterized protein LOC115967117 [Quercus lobata]
MGLKRKPQTSLFELLEGQPGKGVQETPQPNAPSPPPLPQAIQTRLSSSKSQPQFPRPKLPASPPPALPPRPESTDSKRKMSPKGKETVDWGKSQPSKESEEAPRAKQLKIEHQSKGKETEVQPSQGKGKGIEAQSSPSAWLPALMLHGGPLLETASMRDLGDGEGGYVADALGRTMLLPTDVDGLKKMRMQESKAAENERSKRLLAARTLKASKDDLAKAKTALADAIRDRDSASAGLASAQKQVEDQTKRLLEADDQLQIAKELIKDLNKRLVTAEHDKGMAEYAHDEAIRAKREAEFAKNEAEVAKETAKDDGYNAGVAETQAILKAQISGVGASPGEPLKGGELQDVIEASQRSDLEVPEEVAEPVVGTQMPNAEEPAILSQPLQAIPLAMVPQSTDANPAQPSPEGAVIQGTEADPVPPSQDVADAKLKK